MCLIICMKPGRRDHEQPMIGMAKIRTSGQEAYRASAEGRIMYTPHGEPMAEEPAQRLLSPGMGSLQQEDSKQEDHATPTEGCR